MRWKKTSLLASLALALVCSLAAASVARADAWREASGVAVSPDGTTVSAVGRNGVLTFSRDGTTGSLTLTQALSTQGTAIAFSPDGKSAYATYGFADPGTFALQSFARDLANGHLQSVQSIGHEQEGLTSFGWIRGVAVSPDGKSVYVTSSDPGALAIFDRDSQTSVLTLRRVVRNGSGISRMLGASGIAITPDGQIVYLTSINDRALLTFARGPSGDLTFLGDLDLSNTGSGTTGVSLAPDGRHLYVQQAGSPTLIKVVLNQTTRLPQAPTSTIAFGPGGGFTGWFGTRSFDVSADSRTVYSLQSGRNELRAVEVEGPNIGSVSIYAELTDGISGLANPVELAFSPDAERRHLYVVGGTGVSGTRTGTIAVFRRDALTGTLNFVQSLKGLDVPRPVSPAPPGTLPTPAPPQPPTPTVPIKQCPELLAPPTGPIGVSINHGARYTSSPRVTLTVVWPNCTPSLLISNDGGFRPAQRRKVAPQIPWVLDSSGPERLPKTVYMRFGEGPVNFTDDIILDETPPLITSVRAAIVRGATSQQVQATRKRRPAGDRVRVRVRARDRNSGVAVMQLTDNRRRPGPVVKYRPSAVTQTRGSAVFARVRDRAGNWSAWTTIGCFRPTPNRARCLLRARAATNLSVARARARERLKTRLARCRTIASARRTACARSARATHRSAVVRATRTYRLALARNR